MEGELRSGVWEEKEGGVKDEECCVCRRGETGERGRVVAARNRDNCGIHSGPTPLKMRGKMPHEEVQGQTSAEVFFSGKLLSKN